MYIYIYIYTHILNILLCPCVLSFSDINPYIMIMTVTAKWWSSAQQSHF